MIQDLLLDPSLLPVTIVFFVLVLFSYWQKLTRYVPYLAIVYLAFLLFTIFSYSDTTAYQQEDNNNIVEDSMELEVMMIEDSVVQSAGENIQASTGMEVKPFVAPKQPQDNKPKSIFVQRLVVCENIDLKQRKPLRIRDVFIDTTSKIYCFAGLRNPERSENITHVWKFNGEPYATVHLSLIHI